MKVFVAFLRLIWTVFFVFFASVANSNEFGFKGLSFNSEYDVGNGQYTLLNFSVDNPRVGRIPYYNDKDRISFSLVSSYKSAFLRTDIRFRNDWLETRYFVSTSGPEMYLGSKPMSTVERRDLLSLTPHARIMTAWIIANASELIEYALTSEKYISRQSRKQWEKLAKDNLFERNVRQNLGPALYKELASYDQYAKHTPSILRDVIQPYLKKLGYYDANIDGIWGPMTKSAIMNFEKSNGLFPDGVNYGDERVLLAKLAKNFSDSDRLQLNTPFSETEFRKINDITDRQTLEKDLAQAKTLAKRQSSLALERLEQIKKYRSEIEKLTLANDENAALLIKLEKEKQTLEKDLAQAETLAKRQSSLALARLEQIKKYRSEIEKLTLANDESAALLIKLAELKTSRDEAEEKASQALAERDAVKTQLAEALATKNAITERLKKLEKEKQELTKQLEDIKSQIDSSNLVPVFQLSEEWLDVERFLAVQQVRFCQILSNYSVEAKAAAESKNQLRQNLVATNRDNDIAALLPNGNYNDWVAKVVEIYATPSGDAAFVLRLPCTVTFGSGQLNGAGDLNGNYAATAEFGGIIYNQLAQLAEGDMVLISGKILTYDDIGALNQRLKFVTNLNGESPSKSEPRKNRAAPDYFSKIDYLSKL